MTGNRGDYKFNTVRPRPQVRNRDTIPVKAGPQDRTLSRRIEADADSRGPSRDHQYVQNPQTALDVLLSRPMNPLKNNRKSTLHPAGWQERSPTAATVAVPPFPALHSTPPPPHLDYLLTLHIFSSRSSGGAHMPSISGARSLCPP